MRTVVRLGSVDYTREHVECLRTHARERHHEAERLDKTVSQLDALLNAPEPLVAGDIVEYRRGSMGGKRLVVLGSHINETLCHSYGSVEGFVRVTDGLITHYDRPEQFTKVGNLQDAK